jgi:hypothetical protein
VTRPLNPKHADRIISDAAQRITMLAMRTQEHTALGHSATRAEAWMPGPRSGLGAEGPRSSGVSDPTGNAATNTRDPSTRWAIELGLAAHRLADTIAQLEQLCATIDAQADREYDDRTRARKTALGAGACRACGVGCSGIGDDRLRGGLCDADRKRFTRDPGRWGHDQVAFERARMREETQGIEDATYHAG